MTRIGVIGSGWGSRLVCPAPRLFCLPDREPGPRGTGLTILRRSAAASFPRFGAPGLAAPKMDLFLRTLSSGALYLEAVKKSIVARAGGACGARWRSEEEAMR